MCLLVFARNCHPEYPLVVVANRDEYHERAAEPAHWWPESRQLLAGRDLKGGGTWMGVNRAGQWGAVTNYRDGVPEPAARSRGELVTEFLQQQTEPQDYLTDVAARAGEFGGFSLVLGDLDNLYYYSNRRADLQRVGDGIHTLSNHLLNTPWPKSELVRLKLNRLRHKSRLEIDELVAVLGDRQPFDDHELPTTGVGLEMERVLSPPFISGELYGTRCTTVLLVNSRSEALYAEQSYLPNGIKAGLAVFEFPFRHR